MEHRRTASRPHSGGFLSWYNWGQSEVYSVRDGKEKLVAVTGGALDFGPWERIFYGEFDGGRRKRVLVKVIGE